MHYALASRWDTYFWGVLPTVGALFAGRLGALIVAFAKVQSLMGGVILGIFLLGILTKRVSSMGALVGGVIGFALVLSVSLSTGVSFYWYCVVGCIGTMAGGWTVSKLWA
jgi:hypothetical protein